MPKQSPKPAPKNSAPRRATTRVITRTVEQDDGPEEMEEPNGGEEFIDPQEEALESFFSETRGHSGVEIRVYKMDSENRTGARAYATSVSLEDADSGRLMETLQRKWKGGEFELVARAEGRILKRTIVNILPPPEDEKPVQQMQQEQIANILNAAMAPMQQVIAELKQRPQFNFDSLLTKGTMMLPLLQGLRQLIAPTPVGAAPLNPSDPLAMLAQMKQLKDTMDSIGMGDREPDGFDRMMTLFTNFKPMLEKAMAAQQGGTRPVARQPAAPIAAGAMPVAGVPTVQAPTPKVAQIPEAFVPFVPMLAQAAIRGETVESVGDRILAAIPDDLVDPLADALEDGTLLSALLARPEFAGNVGWLNALAKHILSALNSGDESGDDPDDEGENVSGAGDVTGSADDNP